MKPKSLRKGQYFGAVMLSSTVQEYRPRGKQYCLFFLLSLLFIFVLCQLFLLLYFLILLLPLLNLLLIVPLLHLICSLHRFSFFISS
jgi:hypothetical protein